MITIERYTPSHRAEWDDLVGRSRNGTLLHERGYMDYHSDRFVDCSLLARDDVGRLLTALPANRAGDALWSHQGLSYGGWLMSSKRMDAAVMLAVMEAALQWMRGEGITRLVYKPVPHIYHRYPAEEDLYALWRYGATVCETSISSTIDLHDPLPLDRGNKSGLRQALREGVAAAASDRWADYWQLLTAVLAEHHNTRPVHTLDEIALLHSRFPDRIALHTAELRGELLAGVVMYYTPTVAHCQYIASSPTGRELHALTALFEHLKDDARSRGCRYLDFGISTEEHGHVLNTGLLQQKARLGGRGTITQVWEIRL